MKVSTPKPLVKREKMELIRHIVTVLICVGFLIFFEVWAINNRQAEDKKLENDSFVEGWCTEVVRHHEREGAFDRIQCYQKFPEMEVK